MKIEKNLLHFFLIALFCTQCVAQMSEDENLAKKFVESLINDSVAIESVADQFIRYQRDEKGKEFIYTYVGMTRSYLKKEGIRWEDLRIVSFRQAKDQLEGLMVAEDQKNHIYAVLGKDDKLLLPLLIENNQVVSFTTLNKGERRFFMGYGK